jgi:peptidyl-prolyl cis-trans isomerase SurA
MNLRLFRTPAALVFSTVLLASSTLAQTHSAASVSPYGGTPVEEIIARVNDQIITSSDYDRAMKQLDGEERQHGASMQEMSETRANLLRNLIDQQLWLSKGKELDITGETQMINQLNDIRKQYHLATMDDLEKAAKEQGISFEDFKANIRNQVITQEVMRQEVGQKIQITPGEVERYFEAHKQQYAQPESVTLAEILVSTGTSAAGPEDAQTADPAKLAAAKAKADDLEAKLHAGGDFAQLARTFSDGTTAADGGELGQYQRGALAKVLEEKTFALKSGQYTEPIRTRQGYVILKVEQHVPGGVPVFKDVKQKVEEEYYMAKMQPAIRNYLTKMREQDFIEIKPGYTDTGASSNKQVFPISYAAYTPPSPKKKKKVERTRFRESTRSFRQKSSQAASSGAQAEPVAAAEKKHGKKKSKAEEASMKAGKKEKIRFGRAPTETLPSAPATEVEDAGAGPQAAATDQDLVNPLESSAKPKQKTRYSAQAKKTKKANKHAPEFVALDAPDAAEVADRQTQSAPLGLAGDTSKKEAKKDTATTTDKTRFVNKKKTTKKKHETKVQDPGDVHGW